MKHVVDKLIWVMNLKSDFDKNPGSENVNLILFHVDLKTSLIPHVRKPLMAHYHILYLGVSSYYTLPSPCQGLGRGNV